MRPLSIILQKQIVVYLCLHSNLQNVSMETLLSWRMSSEYHHYGWCSSTASGLLIIQLWFEHKRPLGPCKFTRQGPSRLTVSSRSNNDKLTNVNWHILKPVVVTASDGFSQTFKHAQCFSNIWIWRCWILFRLY